ncbi:glycoside hydrolase family 32 protein [Actinopolymorpha alba]|uniref:glycoside hydrolase family 32 protein n=1 Tax=Actinopolymorpha alba TaxID=533267 RepID=UPI000371409E|nr:glycoside hydrolase family 32 protein [Actinopolymorpha alba]
MTDLTAGSAPASAVPDDDRIFPRLHGRPASGWLNDPNGVGRIDGTWHVFYQYNPDEPVHANVHWGHMTSPDLVRWTTRPVALAPRPGGIDAAGCWSGCLVDDHGTPTLVYTAVADRSGAQVVLARGDRALERITPEATAVMGMPADPAITDVRDPYVFTVGERRFAVQGAGARGGVGEILLYACDDLTRWTELGSLLRADHPIVAEAAGAVIWECPNLVPLDDGWLLVVSPLRPEGEGQLRAANVAWIHGDLITAGDSLTFTPRHAGVLDAGPAFYAPQLVAVDGRVLCWGWSWELERTAEQVAAAGWQGVLTFPREVSWAGEAPRLAPARELAALRHAEVAAGAPLPAAFEAVGSALRLTLGGAPCWPADLSVTRVLVDGSLVEAFTDDAQSWTTRAYPEHGVEFAIHGATEIRELRQP